MTTLWHQGGSGDDTTTSWHHDVIATYFQIGRPVTVLQTATRGSGWEEAFSSM